MKPIAKKVVILGGGISGLSAAFYVQKLASDRQLPVEITIVEKNNRVGGRIKTHHRQGFVLEKGPDSFLSRKTAVLDLSRELGLEEELVPTNPQAKTAYILHKNKLHPMPMGFVLGIPTKLTPFIRTGLISPAGKLRAALDLILPARREKEDESLGAFIQRRLGQEVLEHITEPLLSGIYAGNTHSLSLNATFPQFKQMELTHRSLIKGMAKGSGSRPSTHATQGQGKHNAQVARSMFLSYRGGLSTLIKRLEERLHTAQFVVGQGAVAIRKEEQYHVSLENGQQLEADSIICAVPAYEAARLLSEVPEADCLQDIAYVSVANISLAYRKKDLGVAFEGTGFLVPRKEGRMITACTWSSTKWKHTAPEDYALVRTYIGHAGAKEWTQWTNEELVAAARRDLLELTGLKAEPMMVEVSRCNDAMPQYPLGHLERLKSLRSTLSERLPGVWLCGAGYGGVGIPDCIAQGKAAAEQLLAAYTDI